MLSTSLLIAVGLTRPTALRSSYHATNESLILDCLWTFASVKVPDQRQRSLVRDVAMAKLAGVTAIWARYGTKYDPEYWTYLVKVTHWTDEDVSREKGLKAKYGNVVPDYAIDSFPQLKSIVLEGITQPLDPSAWAANNP
jgi:hypothetical protein